MVVLAGRSSNRYAPHIFYECYFKINCLRITETAENIKKETPDAHLKELLLDLSSQKAIRQAAGEVLEYDAPIDVLILNAGLVCNSLPIYRPK